MGSTSLLEMISPSVTPEHGVRIYENDPTQGPACAIAAGAGTIYRNYFAPVNGQIGQSENNQIDCLEAIGGFNAFLAEQQKEEGEATLSLILFDHEYTTITSCTPIADVQPLNRETYEPRGMTALLDAMGRTIDDLGKQLADTPEAERPDAVIVVTLTDGMENSSSDYTKAEVAAKVKHQQEKYGWQFIFMGADLETTEQAEDLNIAQADRAVYSCVQEGMALNSQEISKRRRAQRKKKIGF